MNLNVRFVLVETSHPGNIGSTARAMRTMGFTELALVRPLQFPHADATALAAGADDVLANAQVHDTLADALTGCQRIYATSARDRTLGWPMADPHTAAQAVAQQGGTVAFVFGRERTGLTNAELDHCHAMLRIPTGAGYTSLNLAQAVQIVAYELRVALGDASGSVVADEPVAGFEEMERFYEHLQRTLADIGFLDPESPRQLMRRLRRYFNRSSPTVTELNILRGILRNAGEPEPGSAARARILASRSAAPDDTISDRNDQE